MRARLAAKVIENREKRARGEFVGKTSDDAPTVRKFNAILTGTDMEKLFESNFIGSLGIKPRSVDSVIRRAKAFQREDRTRFVTLQQVISASPAIQRLPGSRKPVRTARVEVRRFRI